MYLADGILQRYDACTALKSNVLLLIFFLMSSYLVSFFWGERDGFFKEDRNLGLAQCLESGKKCREQTHTFGTRDSVSAVAASVTLVMGVMESTIPPHTSIQQMVAYSRERRQYITPRN